MVFFWSYSFKKLKRRKTKFLLDKAKHVQPMTLTSDLAAGESDLLNKAEGML